MQHLASPATLLRAVAAYVNRLRGAAERGELLNTENPTPRGAEAVVVHRAQRAAYERIERLLVCLARRADGCLDGAADALHHDVELAALVDAPPLSASALSWTAEDLARANHVADKLEKRALARLAIVHDRHRADRIPEDHGSLHGSPSPATSTTQP